MLTFEKVFSVFESFLAENGIYGAVSVRQSQEESINGRLSDRIGKSRCTSFFRRASALLVIPYRPYLKGVEQMAEQRMDTLLPQLMKAAGVTEELKACE